MNAAGDRKRAAARIMANMAAVRASDSESIKKVEMQTIKFMEEKMIKQGRALSFLRSMAEYIKKDKITKPAARAK